MTITVEDHATPAIQAMVARLSNRRPLMQAMGKSAEVALRAHFTRRDSEGNKHGWPSKHFWSRVVRKMTAYQGATETEATVTVASSEFAHKVTGGTITPSKGKYLAIPLTARAYAVGRPALWPGGRSALTFIKTGRAAILVEAYHQRLGKRNQGKMLGGAPQYILVKSARQAADPRSLPSNSELSAKVTETARDYLARRFPSS